jgi:hypothetical protein
MHRRITVQTGTGINMGPYSKNNLSKKGHDSNERAPAYQEALASNPSTAKLIS